MFVPCLFPSDLKTVGWPALAGVPGTVSRDIWVMHGWGGTRPNLVTHSGAQVEGFQMGLLVKEHAGAFAGVTDLRTATAGQRTEERQLHRLPSVDVMDFPHLAGMPPLPPVGEPFDVWEVVLLERGWTPELVFIGSRDQCQAFADECRADTIGCHFLVRRSGRTIGGMEGGAQC